MITSRNERLFGRPVPFPRIADIFDTCLKFIELFGIQSEGTMATQRLLRRKRIWFAPSFYRCEEPLPSAHLPWNFTNN